MTDLAFVLVAEPRYPESADVIAAAERAGIVLRVTPDQSGDMLSFELDGGGLFVAMLMTAPHPDAPTMPVGPTSVPTDIASAAPAHFILTAMGLRGGDRQRDAQMAALASTIIDTTPAVAAMLGHGVVFHKAQLFSELARLGAREGALPPELAIDVTVAQESQTRMSFLTHHMPRYGREDFYVTCPIRGRNAFDFVLSLVRWMLTDPDKQLPTGDTIGRSAEEKIRIQRVPNPARPGEQVIRLDLPT